MDLYTRHWISSTLALMALFNVPQAWPDGKQGFLFFLSAGPSYHDVTPDDGPEDYEFDVDADILYSYLNGRFRLLGEYLAATEETELERFQLGWEAGQETIGWLGRFHSPSRYWNIAYHHGQYMQTSISRPVVEQFEDDGGILPTHSTGLMVETAHKLEGAADFRVTFSLGAAPIIDRNELKPFDLLDPGSSNRAAADMRLAYLPDQLGENQIGLLLNWSELEVDGSHTAEQQGLQRVKQISIGAYFDWRWQDWRFISTLTPVINRMKRQAHNQTDSFLSGYFQAEYELKHAWTLFGRLEQTNNTSSSDYLELFPHSVTDRQMLGLRFDVARQQALTLEISRAETPSDSDFEQYLLQWSAVIP
ncbi:MAG: hypothetical protein U9P00_09575 [Pseudomonadota bacterium]|nr:hypothetical protein [Pseudomonadota bacterium]